MESILPAAAFAVLVIAHLAAVVAVRLPAPGDSSRRTLVTSAWKDPSAD